jgi:lysophospholipid hydrolase
VTFNAAHKYLGLTTEVLRTEKAINDIACHPLPSSFYEGGGLQYLRCRFDAGGQTVEDTYGDYFNQIPPSVVLTSSKRSAHSILSNENGANGSIPKHTSDVMARASFRKRTSRQHVQAGDLHSTTGHASETYRPLTRMLSVSNASLSRLEDKDGDNSKVALPRLSGDEFDLRDEVMSCIAKSIGLLQPPLSGTDSVEASPAFPPTEGKPPRVFNSSFGSLSLLDIGDDGSSMTGDSSATSSVYLSGLDNEVEILFFAAGSTLARAGERNTGRYPSFHRQTI